jgi:hypothetical protein
MLPLARSVLEIIKMATEAPVAIFKEC